MRAFAAAFRNGPPRVTLDIGGDGPQRRELESLAHNLGVADRVHFLGSLSQRQVKEALWRSNFFVLPSFVETFGVVFIEAMATGLPVIGTRCGGPDDFILADVGMLIEPGDVENLSQALISAYKNYSYYKKRENLIIKYAKNNFDSRKISSNLLVEYKSIVGVTKKLL